MAKEEWLPVREFPEHYEISSLGRLRRINNYRNPLSDGMKKPRFCKRGYLWYCLSVCNFPYTRSAHRMVADAFLGPIPEGMQVNHKDGDKSNSVLDNLEIVTNGENREHSYKVLGVKPNGLKIDKGKATEIRRLYKTGEYSQHNLAEMFGVSQEVISRNVKDMKCKTRASKGEKNGCAKLTTEQVKRIREIIANGNMNIKSAAKHFNVSDTLIRKIVNRDLWFDV